MRDRSFLLSLLLAVALPLAAQNITGTITGAVEDQTGAKLVGAKVAALNKDTGIVYRATTTEAGIYVLPSLPLGAYEITVENSGFRKFVRSNIALGADQRVRIDARLELGTMAENVTVTAEAPLVQSEQATVGSSFVPSQFQRLPIGRDVLSMMQLVPGVQAAKNGFATGNINGSRESVTDYKVDGAAATLATQGTARIAPIQEMVEEVVVQTANYSAEFGRGAAQVTLTTRAGTNEYHGALFHYFRNDVLNANSFMNNFFGNNKPILRYNLFGGTIGGPVVLPKLYDGHNRTFFTFGYEGTRQRGYGQMVSSVPTPNMRAGDFSGMTTIYDPASTQPNTAGKGYVRTAFPQNRIPTSRLDSIALNMLDVAYPLPTRPGVANNYVNAGPNSTTNDAINARVDHNFSDKSRLTTRYIYRRNLTVNLNRFPGPAGASSNSTSLFSNVFNHVVSAEHTYLVRSNLINTFRFGFYYDDAPKGGPGTNEGWAEKLGIKNAGPEKFPLVSITALSPFGGSNLANQTPASNFQATDSLLLVTGRHSLKFGFDYRKLRSFTWQPGNPSGSFTFNTLATLNPVNQKDGIGFASYLLGIPSSSAISIYPQDGFGIRWSYFGGFIQDDFRAAKNLTLNLGLRWEMNTGRREVNNRQSNLDLSTLQLRYAGQNGYPETLFDADWRNFQPRIGLAYTPFGGTRTVIRAGYGLFILPANAMGDAPFTTGPWSRGLSYFSQDNGITFPMTMRDGFPAVPPESPLVLGPNTGVAWMPRDYPSAYMQQWSFNIQHELPGRTLVEVGYLGSKGNHLPINYQLNQVPANLLGPGNSQLRRPYPTIGSISGSFAPIGNSVYHAAQVRIERRFSKGFSYQASYTFGKSIDDCSGTFDYRAYGVTGVQDNFNLSAERSVSGFDITHNFAWSMSYALPFGRDRRFLSRGGIVDAIFGGWNFSTISSLMSGMPLIMGTVQNLTGSLGGGSRPNRLANGKLSGSERSIYRWFDASAYAQPEPYTFGNGSRTEPILRDPGEFNMGALLAKEFRIAEKKTLQFRSEFSNVLNHFNPGTPNTTIGHAAVGTITGGNGGRNILLALKFIY